MKALKINKSLWSLPLDFSFDSSEINELIKVMDIELQEVVISPNLAKKFINKITSIVSFK